VKEGRIQRTNFSLPTLRLSFLLLIFPFLPYIKTSERFAKKKNFGTHFFKFSEVFLVQIWKTHSEVFSQGKKIRKTRFEIFTTSVPKYKNLLTIARMPMHNFDYEYL
jgi:hypothetical protein